MDLHLTEGYFSGSTDVVTPLPDTSTFAIKVAWGNKAEGGVEVRKKYLETQNYRHF